MKSVHILAVTFSLASILAPCFSSVITPTVGQVHSHRHELGKLNTVDRQKKCASKEDCDGGACLTDQGECQTSNCDGVCLDLNQCSCDDPCDSGTTCVTVSLGDNSRATCIPDSSVEGANTASAISDIIGVDVGFKVLDCDESSNGSEESDSSDGENGDPVCIGVDLLQDFASHQLVFEKHTLARVLCDSSLSCATRGHMVNYGGKAMMMGTYCNIVGCEQKVMKVNSPKYERGLKVASRSPNMHFTAFAARYGTNAEEAVLAAAVRVGL